MDHNDPQRLWTIVVGMLVVIVIISWILLMAVCLKKYMYICSHAKKG